MSTRTPTEQTRGGRLGRRGPLRGLSLVEVLVALAIVALLLTAAAAAFSASSNVVEANDQFFRATQAARVSLHQILTNVRRGSVNQTWDANNLRLITALNEDGTGDDDYTYKFVPATKQLVLVTNDDPSDGDFPLASNVSAMTFDVEIGEDYTRAPCVVRVDVSITVKVGGNVVTLSGSAAPRRNIVY